MRRVEKFITCFMQTHKRDDQNEKKSRDGWQLKYCYRSPS